jgi:hypothetical protein
MPTWKPIVGKKFSPEELALHVAGLDLKVWCPKFVVLHNTGAPTFADWHNIAGEQRMKNLEHYYRDVQGWSAGPHLFIADDFIWNFSPLDSPGVHSPSWNRISWGVELVGDYSFEEMSDGVKKNMISALSILHARAGLDPDTLRLHREDPKTTHCCPGDKIVKADVIGWVREINPHLKDATSLKAAAK